MIVVRSGRNCSDEEDEGIAAALENGIEVSL